jgi:hypothetical protein
LKLAYAPEALALTCAPEAYAPEVEFPVLLLFGDEDKYSEEVYAEEEFFDDE